MTADKHMTNVETAKWDQSTPDYAFLLEAVEIVGKHLFKDDWTGQEQSIIRLQREKMLRAAKEAKRAPKRQVPEWAKYQRQQKQSATHAEPTPVPDRQRAEGLERLNTVRREIVDGICKGRLVWAVRKVEGGPISDCISADLWNTERWQYRFEHGQMQSREPFAMSADGDQYIFIERNSLNGYLANRDREQRPPTQHHPPAKMREAAAKIISECKVGDSPTRGRVTQPEFEAEMRRLFQGVIRVSLRLLWDEFKPEDTKPGRPVNDSGS